MCIVKFTITEARGQLVWGAGCLSGIRKQVDMLSGIKPAMPSRTIGFPCEGFATQFESSACNMTECKPKCSAVQSSMHIYIVSAGQRGVPLKQLL